MLKWLVYAAFVGILVALVAVFSWSGTALPLSQARAVDVKPGSGLSVIGRQLQHAGILPKGHQALIKWWFLAYASGEAGHVQAGFYVVEPGTSPWNLLRKMVHGDVTPRHIQFIEGWTFAQMREVLNQYPWIAHDTENMSDAEILRALSIPHRHAEGRFFPDTYDIASGNDDLSILRRAYTTMQQRLMSAWQTRDPGLPYQTPQQALIMASIIEKETGNANERPLVASVFVNRLRLGMRLRTDPTVIYGLGNVFEGRLHKKDLLTDTPWNTYTRYGLPATPIDMPGMASIQAALHPAHSNDLYFVAKGDGTHVFSTDLSAHNRAVNVYQKQRMPGVR